MTSRRTLPTLFGLLALLGCSGTDANSLMVGQPAPPFTLHDQDGKLRRLSDYAGKWLVVYFYPKDDTPGCTKEACHFRDDMAKLHALGVQLVGISLDSSASHDQFARKFRLPFPLLADDGGTVARRYDAYWSFAFIRFARRHTFIIDPAGHIAKIYRNVDPDTHSAQVITDIKTLQQRSGA
ncbi:MAG: peroxiredoxin [Gammaproteobacteria bacterium]|jgi:peroxiredoxin Q/BCP